MNGLRIGSLFSGIGGLELGLERAGVGQTVWQCEIDPWARGILRKHWPKVPCHDDVRTFHPGRGSADLVCLGFPCQDISQAGEGLGIAEGTRSGLWFEGRRVIREVGPEWVVVENVAILRKRGLHIVLGDLAALGFDAEWDCIPAASVGAPHLRDRMFILAHANGGRRIHGPPEVVAADGREPALSLSRGGRHEVSDPNGVLGYQGRPNHAAEEPRGGHAHRVGSPAEVRHAHGLRLALGQGFGRDARQELQAFERANRAPGGWWATEPNVGRVADGVPSRVDRIRGLGNAVSPYVSEFIGRRLRSMIEPFAIEEVAKAPDGA